MPKMKQFENLTWEALEGWAGRKVTSRGKSLVKQVSELGVLPDGGLLACVQGGRLYATRVWREKGGLRSICSCPYGLSCKHAVATVLAYLEAVGEGAEIPAAEAEDRRLSILEGEDASAEFDDGEDQAGSAVDPVQEMLAALSASERKKLLADLVREVPGAADWVSERALLKKADPSKLVASIRKVLNTAGPYQGWDDRWHGPDVVDFSKVEKRLRRLLDAGRADEVVELAPRLLEAGGEQAVTPGCDDWDIQYGMEQCMKIVYQALDRCSLAPAERILCEMDLIQQDDYGLATLDDREAFLLNGQEPPPPVWSEVADNLLARLDAMDVGEERDYKRKQLIRWGADALRGAERLEDLTAFLKREAELGGCHEELVDHLIALGRTDEAAAAAREGIRRTRERLPGVASALETKLRELAEASDDPALAAAFRVREFLQTPTTETYQGALTAVDPLGLRASVRSFLLKWLETGSLPLRHPDWPLPSTGLPDPESGYGRPRFPNPAALIDIAILENRKEDALRWFRSMNPKGAGPEYGPGDRVAAAVRDAYPDEALSIWRERAENHIRQTKPAAYQVAGGYLRKMREVLTEHGRGGEWTQLLRTLRETHRRKRRFLEVLDRLEGKEHKILP